MRLIPLLAVQVVVVLVVARLFAALARRVGQPAVVGEMVAGLALGPSLFGLVAPTAQARLFPESSFGALSALSLVGLVIFMFLVGAELNVGSLRRRAPLAALVTPASIVVPFALGAMLAVAIRPALAPAGVPLLPFALFMGAALSVTAFPVLARILAERSLTSTPLGAIAIACAALDDVVAWCLLALVGAVMTRNGLAGFLLTAGGAAAFALGMLTVGRRGIGALARVARQPGPIGMVALVAILAIAFGGAWLTHTIGVHALFGAFLTGLALPHDEQLRSTLTARLGTFSAAVLLPVYFAFTGLRTELALLDSTALWLICGAVIVAAVAGKLGGSAVAARLGGMSWRESMALGLLLNTRGLMELVIANAGLDLGVISMPLFAMLVTMALVTTVGTAPALRRLGTG